MIVRSPTTSFLPNFDFSSIQNDLNSVTYFYQNMQIPVNKCESLMPNES